MKKRNFSIEYNNIKFDSKWEIIFYLYCIQNGHYIEREPFSIPYKVNNENHLYYPDFWVDDTLVEIKGPQFYNDKGELFSPFDSIDDPVQEVYKEKGKLIERLNVFIIKDIQPYKKFIETKNDPFIESLMQVR